MNRLIMFAETSRNKRCSKVCAADNDVPFEIELHSGNICTLANDAFGPLWKLLDRRGQ